VFRRGRSRRVRSPCQRSTRNGCVKVRIGFCRSCFRRCPCRAPRGCGDSDTGDPIRQAHAMPGSQASAAEAGPAWQTGAAGVRLLPCGGRRRHDRPAGAGAQPLEGPRRSGPRRLASGTVPSGVRPQRKANGRVPAARRNSPLSRAAFTVRKDTRRKPGVAAPEVETPAARPACRSVFSPRSRPRPTGAIELTLISLAEAGGGRW